MKNTFSTIVFVLFLFGTGKTQEFWSMNRFYPKEPTTGIAILNDNTLIVSSLNRIWKSKDDGRTWKCVFHNPGINAVYGHTAGIVIAGGTGNIYTSFDFGLTWTTATVNTQHKIQEMIATSDGKLFAIGLADTSHTPTTGSVYFSDDNGITWIPILTSNSDINYYDHIAVDRKDRIYVTAASHNDSGTGGLYISESYGQKWMHIQIAINGNSTVNDTIVVRSTNGLSIGADDLIYLSVNGFAATVPVRLNVRKKTSDLMTDKRWLVSSVTPSWWFDKRMQDVFVASSGDLYSSVEGLFQTGGTVFQETGKSEWSVFRNDLGHNIHFNKQCFAEDLKGVVYMVHALDINLYFTSHRATTSIKETQSGNTFLFPNPSKPDTEVFIGEHLNDKGVLITDLPGYFQKQTVVKNNRIKLNVPAGIYILTLESTGLILGKILVTN